METRACEKIYLLEHDESQIVGSKLPSNGQILRVLFYNMRKVKLDLRSSAYLVIKEAEILWSKARIPVRQIDRSVQKVEALYQQWKNLQKNCKRPTPLQKTREDEFLSNLNNLFDIAHGDALDLIKIEEDKEFLLNQRKEGRPGAMVGCDRLLFEKEKRKNFRIQKELTRKAKQTASCNTRSATQFQSDITAENITDNAENPNDMEICESDLSFEQIANCNIARANRKRGMKHFITPKLVATLDKCKVSDRDAVRILIAVAEALDHDISKLVISKTSIRLCRKQFRSECAAKLVKSFQEQNIKQVTVHWDGKILPSLTGKEKVDRLPVVITSNGIEHLLGIPVLPAGTGKDQAEAITQLLIDWNLTEKVQALCFDTTATNTGRLKGACVLLEQYFNRDIFYLPCRHHIYEILLKSAFEKYNFPMSGPTLSIFQRFKTTWTKLNLQKFKSGILDRRINASISISEQDKLTQFANNYVAKQHARADYKELLELILVFLGRHGEPFKFKSPGAFHHAQWMAKAIYALKIFLFREEFSMSLVETDAIREINLFILKIYVQPWIEAPIAAKAPLNDLNFVKNIIQFKELNEVISVEVARKFSKHLWYLAPEAVALSFFDTDIELEEKRNMVLKLKEDQNNDNKRLIIDIQQLKTKTIADLVSKKTLKFFERFSISTDFLNIDPSKWHNESGFKLGLNIVENLHVVNDTAERFVKLMEDYNAALTKNEEEKQYILQIVTDYQKNYGSANKGDLCG